MNTVGKILQKSRLTQKISLKQVEAATKIRQEYLSALESDAWQKMPSLASTKGFVKNYAEFLGLSSEKLLAVFRRDFGERQKNQAVFQKKTFPLGLGQFYWTPQLTLATIVGVIFLILLGYLGYQYFFLIRTPSLTVSFPLPGQTVNQAAIEVRGQSDSDAVVMVNGQTVLVSSQGSFRSQVDLFPGENRIVVEAISRLGKRTTLIRTVVRLDTER